VAQSHHRRCRAWCDRRSHGGALYYFYPSNHKWFRNLAVSQIIADTMDEMSLKLPPTHVDIADVRRYRAAEQAQAKTAADAAWTGDKT
jgi:hypothetical protein